MPTSASSRKNGVKMICAKISHICVSTADAVLHTPIMKKIMIMGLALIYLSVNQSEAQTDFWDQSPISYGDTAATDRLAKLKIAFESGDVRFDQKSDPARLKFILKTLDIPEESQILVFSKTSFQNSLINPSNPRALYFSENAYVGYVPGGAVEAIVQDPILGPVFYIIETGKKGKILIERDTRKCLSCHATSRTENVPGVLIRSVFADELGRPLLQLGSTDIDQRTPIAQRWGGYYVTGNSSLPHLGNRIFTTDGDSSPKSSHLKDMSEVINVSNYPQVTSDIVALLILEHQCQIHNAINAATLNYRRLRFFSETLNPSDDPDKGSAGAVADSWAKTITECLFFKNEANLKDGVEGDERFEEAFQARYPRTADGQSLADFKLYGRIFKHRCSYMIYSQAFQNLPPSIKNRVYANMNKTLLGENPEIDWLSKSERKKISHILTATLKDWKKS